MFREIAEADADARCRCRLQMRFLDKIGVPCSWSRAQDRLDEAT